MRNINELIGIIRAIDFDSVINQKEIDRLRNWVNHNRNLAFEKAHISLIKLVDEVIEDNIITEEEKEKLFAYCNDIQSKSADSSMKIFELNGIIEGVICDGEVNEDEVVKLKQWMEDNRNFIEKYEPANDLLILIDDILEDSIVTEEEQDKLLRRLSEHINESQLDMKLNYLKKKVQNKENIGTDLIDLLDNEKAIEEIHDQAELYLLSQINNYTKSTKDSEIVFISLVLIGMLYYDGNFWDNVRSTYRNLYKRYSPQIIEGYIRSVFRKFNAEKYTKEKTTRYINIALRNAIVPANFLTSFFEFVFDIYKLNFEYSIPENLYEEFEFVYSGLRNNLKNNDDELSLDVTKKTYKLIKTTKELIANKEDVDHVIHLSIIVVKLIDKYVWNKELKIYNPYLKGGFDSWAKIYDEECEENICASSKKMVSRWQPKFSLTDNNIYIIPPIHKVRTDHYYDLEIAVYHNDKEILRINRPDVREILGGFKVSCDRIAITKPLGKLKYKLLQGQKVVYDSKDKLHRDYIVFDYNGEEIKNNTEYKGTVVLISKDEQSGFNLIKKRNDYVVSSRNVQIGESVVIDDNIFNFSKLFKPGIFGDVYSNHFLFDVYNEKRLMVYKNIKYLMFESDKKNAEFTIIIDRVEKKLETFSYTTFDREGARKYSISMPDIDSGVHNIKIKEICDIKSKNIFSEEFVIDKKLETNCVRLDENMYLATIKTDLINSTFSIELNTEEFDLDGVEIKYNNMKYKYQIPFELDFYRISGGKWKNTRQGIWIDDIKQDTMLQLYGNNIETMIVMPEGALPIFDVPKIQNKGIYQQIPVGFLASYKNDYNYVLLAFVINGRVKKGIFCDNKCNLSENHTIIEFNGSDNTLEIIPKYNGIGNVFIKLIDENNEEIARSPVVRNKEKYVFNEILSFKKYTIQFFEKGIVKGLSLATKKERLMKEYSFVFSGENDLIGKIFDIDCINYVKHLRDGDREYTKKILKTNIEFIKKTEDGRYIGQIKAYLSATYMSLRNINPVLIEVCGETADDGNLEIIVTHKGKSLFYVEKEDRIFNGILEQADFMIPSIDTMNINVLRKNK